MSHGPSGRDQTQNLFDSQAPNDPLQVATALSTAHSNRMATDASDLFSTPTVAGLVVAGLSLGAVYAFSYTRLGRILGGAGSEEDYTHTRTRGDASTRSRKGSEDDREKDAVATRSTAAVRKGRKKKGKGVEGGEGEGWGGDEAQVKTGGRRKPGGRGEAKAGVPSVVPFPRVVPGSFEGARADVGSSEALSAEAASAGDKTQKRKRTKKKQKKDKGKDGDEDKGAGSETGREVDVRHTAAHPSRSRSGDSTDASPSASGDAQPVAPRPTARGKATSLAPPTSQPHAQPRGIRPSLSFANDTDSSWTHVDRRRLRASKSADGQARSLTDAMDATSSDLASTASDSPVAERMDLDVALDTRGARADSEQRTLAERLVPRPRKTGVDEYVPVLRFFFSLVCLLSQELDHILLTTISIFCKMLISFLVCWNSPNSLLWHVSCGYSLRRTKRPSQASRGRTTEMSLRRACLSTMPMKKTKANGASSRVAIEHVILLSLSFP